MCAYTRDRATERPRVSVVSVFARIYVFSLESVGGCYCCFCLYYRLSALLCLFSFARSIVISSLLEFKHPCQMSREKKPKWNLAIFNLESKFSLVLFNSTLRACHSRIRHHCRIFFDPTFLFFALFFSRFQIIFMRWPQIFFRLALALIDIVHFSLVWIMSLLMFVCLLVRLCAREILRLFCYSRGHTRYISPDTDLGHTYGLRLRHYVGNSTWTHCLTYRRFTVLLCFPFRRPLFLLLFLHSVPMFEFDACTVQSIRFN